MKKSKYEVKHAEVFGRLTVTSVKSGYRHKTWYHTVKCECGIILEVAHSNLVLGKSKSCGCLSREMTGKRATTHGMSKSPEYMTWNRMWSRCTNPVVERYPLYGGRGITVCKEWEKFEAFYADMGPKPSDKHSLGRIDNNGNYCKENCRWETAEEQHSNTSTNLFIEHEGLRLTATQWARRIGVSADTIRQRHYAGMPAERILKNKNLSKRAITVDGETKLTVEWMRYAEIPISSFYLCQRKGMSKEDIVRKYLKLRKLREHQP